MAGGGVDDAVRCEPLSANFLTKLMRLTTDLVDAYAAVDDLTMGTLNFLLKY
jgi:hypothetical protein